MRAQVQISLGPFSFQLGCKMKSNYPKYIECSDGTKYVLIVDPFVLAAAERKHAIVRADGKETQSTDLYKVFMYAAVEAFKNIR